MGLSQENCVSILRVLEKIKIATRLNIIRKN